MRRRCEAYEAYVHRFGRPCALGPREVAREVYVYRPRVRAGVARPTFTALAVYEAYVYCFGRLCAPAPRVISTASAARERRRRRLWGAAWRRKANVFKSAADRMELV